MNVLPLVGIESWHATQAVYKLLYGVKMLPEYQHISFENFFPAIDAMNPQDQETLMRQSIVIVKLEREEILDICKWCTDLNGVHYGTAQLKSAKPELIFEIIFAVSMAIVKSHNIRLVTDDEKKNLELAP